MTYSGEHDIQVPHTTAHHAKYFAWELTRRRAASEEDRLAQSLFDASVDLNPHQIDAALFALNNPLSKGVVLADEVGLGKTIEAALVLCQLWAERRRRLLVICPAALRKQWAQELSDKFNLPAEVLDARTWHRLREGGIYDPLDRDVISVMSIHFAARMEAQLAAVPWDVVVIDEAHKLRNAHRKSHETGQALKRALGGRKKLLLTATPLQNSLMELYGLTSLIDEEIFGDERSFRSQYSSIDGDIQSLRRRLQPFIKRTLRRDVLEYVPYTQRHALTTPFSPSEEEVRFYELISAYLQRDFSYGFPTRQKHLVGLILRKLLASSTEAVVATLDAIRTRLQRLLDKQTIDEEWIQQLIENEDLDEDLLEEDDPVASQADGTPPVDYALVREELAELDEYLRLARNIREDQKSHALLSALQQGFERMSTTCRTAAKTNSAYTAQTTCSLRGLRLRYVSLLHQGINMTLPPFVTHPTQVLENAIQFQRDLLSNKNLAALLSSFVSWYAFKKPQGEIIFVPSKFGGYQNMNASTYLQINQLTNGRETEAVLSRWFERPSVLEEQALLAELANHLSKFGKAVNKRARVSTLSGRTITSAVEGTAQSSPLVMALKTIYDKLEEAEKVEFLRLVRESSTSDEEK